MNRKLFAATLCLLVASPLSAVDAIWNYAVELSATVQPAPAAVTLSWRQDTQGTPDSYSIFRKAPDSGSWGSPIASLSGGVTSFTDTGVAAGAAYEYQVIKDFSSRGYKGYGYILAGIQAPLADDRGKVVLIVDDAVAGSLASELLRLENDLVGDGWTVARHDVGRGDSVSSVKNLIRADYNAEPSRVKSVFLFGHVPVPYSGNYNPDGHPDHIGAWPADVYYGALDGNWTDSTVTSSNFGNTDPVDAARIRNVPGDGKFDQSDIPGSVQLQVGRVDLYNMPGYRSFQADPSFPGEIDLLRRYLEKDHAFRHATLAVQKRAVIADYTGDHEGIAAAASAYRSFAPIVGSNTIRDLNVAFNDAKGVFLPELRSNDYLFAEAAGAGSYSSMGGLGSQGQFFDATTTDFVNQDIRAMFMMIFGSWVGDWDHQDSIMRAVLATPSFGLAAMFSGVPHWYLHPMGLGETIGYATRLTQNNQGFYQHQLNLTPRGVHLALMGDPTLRLNPIAPPSALSGTASAGQVSLSWGASSAGSIIGYHVYRAGSPNGPFTRLTGSPVGQTSYTDSGAPTGATYMVRAVRLEVTPSGTYYNASQGIFVSPSGSTGGGGGGGGGGGVIIGGGTPGTGSRLANLSVRSLAGSGAETLIVGFVVGGAGTSGQVPLLIRASGPAIVQYGVSGVLPDPVVTMYQGSNATGQNNNWGSNASAVTTAGNFVGAFQYADTSSRDAAMVAANGIGPYTVQVTDSGGSTGIALAELYDASGGGDSTPRLINVAARAQVGNGDNILIVGFVISGTTSQQVLIRGLGPSLTKLGVTGALARPQLKLYSSTGTLLASNNGWGGDASLAAVFRQIGAADLEPGSADDALLVTLPPGGYTAHISGENGSTGVGMAEVYEVR